MTTIGLIGAGNIGQAVARLAVDHGYDVVLSNSRGPETLTDVVAGLGAARAGRHRRGRRRARRHRRGDRAVQGLPGRARSSRSPARSSSTPTTTTRSATARSPRSTTRPTTSASLLQEHLPKSQVVKAFNHIQSAHLTEHAQAAGHRRPSRAGDRRRPRRGQGHRREAHRRARLRRRRRRPAGRVAGASSPDTPGYGPRLDADGMREALAAAPALTPRVGGVLSPRDLNRTLLLRQHLLERTTMPALDDGRAPRRPAGAGEPAAVPLAGRAPRRLRPARAVGCARGGRGGAAC